MVNKDFQIINIIHSLSDISLKEKYYNMYTNNYSQLKDIRSIDLIKIFNFHFNQHFSDLTLFIPFTNSYTKIIVALSEK